MFIAQDDCLSTEMLFDRSGIINKIHLKFPKCMGPGSCELSLVRSIIILKFAIRMHKICREIWHTNIDLSTDGLNGQFSICPVFQYRDFIHLDRHSLH